MLNLKSCLLLIGLIFSFARHFGCTEHWTPSTRCSELTESGLISYDAHQEELLCWTILNPHNKLIRLEILELKFVAKDCVRNYLKIEKTGDDSVLLLCIDSDIPNYIASESEVEIKFRTEERWNAYATCKVYFEIRDIRCSDENVFRCSNLSCISRLKVCDGIKDCSNGLDEKDCPYNNGNGSPTDGHNVGKNILRDCIEFELEDEEIETDNRNEHWMQQGEHNETTTSEQFNSSLKASAGHIKMEKPKITRKAAKAVDAIIAAKEAAKIFFENEENRAKERHMWLKAHNEKEEMQISEKHALETEFLRTKIESAKNDS